MHLLVTWSNAEAASLIVDFYLLPKLVQPRVKQLVEHDQTIAKHRVACMFQSKHSKEQIEF